MGEISIRFIDDEHASDINIKNEPFQLFGRMRPCYQDGRWSFSTVEHEQIQWDIFPDENYDYKKMKPDHIFIGAYDGSACIGLAILRKQWHKYIYLYDLKVNRSYRGRHIASKMIDWLTAGIRQIYEKHNSVPSLIPFTVFDESGPK